MRELPTLESPFREAVAAIDAGDVAALEGLFAAHPRLVTERIDGGDGYFARPYLLWYVAENPVRNDRLPPNVADVARRIVDEVRSRSPETLREQVTYALELVCSGRVPRESGHQHALIDVLMDAGAETDGAMRAALAHRELAAVDHLLRHGAALTLFAAAALGREDAVARLLPASTADERQQALTGAALLGHANVLPAILAAGVDVGAHSPAGLHPHATPLHHAVDSGSLDAVKLLVEAGAPLATHDRVYGGTPLGWAEYLGRDEIAAYLRSVGAPSD